MPALPANGSDSDGWRTPTLILDDTDILFQMDIEQSQNQNLKCSVCNNYLNVAPVMTSDDGTVNKCGRCLFREPILNNRNTLYESIGAKLNFPCAHEDCTDRISWPEVQKHERSCRHRKIECPFWNCRDKGLDFVIMNDISHFETCHPGSLHKDKLTLSLQNVTHLQSFMKLLMVNDTPFLIMVHCIKFGEMVLIGVYNFDSKIYDYEIKMYSDQHNRRYLVFKERVFLYAEDQHCLYCLQNICELQTHRFSKKYPDMQKDKYKYYAKIDTMCTKNVLITENVLFEIVIREKQDVKAENSSSER
ncbi:unnamed protein product [Callosobruchus maculatus]|uniref:Uncharacterized protein n=1 Tax=Callosobruchus maculatus TaxID=64391 RepID=A0A653BUB3_CALMS|nr:unnamed protein product [Callosobruchus maculatus]